MATLPNTFVLYESPHRLLRCIEELMAVCGPERRACVARELSKLHEELHRGSLDELRAYFSDASKVRGEIAIVVAGNE